MYDPDELYHDDNHCDDCGSRFDSSGWCPYCDIDPEEFYDWGEYHFDVWLAESDPDIWEMKYGKTNTSDSSNTG